MNNTVEEFTNRKAAYEKLCNEVKAAFQALEKKNAEKNTSFSASKFGWSGLIKIKL